MDVRNQFWQGSIMFHNFLPKLMKIYKNWKYGKGHNSFIFMLFFIVIIYLLE